MRKANALALIAIVGIFIAATNARSDQLPEIFISVQVDPEPYPGDGRYLQTATVVLNMEALREPAHRLTLNLPGREPEVVELRHWEPRQGYIQIADPDDPTGMGTITIPDPNARPEDFWWRWYGKSANYTVAVTAVKGVVAGRVSGTTHRYAVSPRGADSHIRLGLVNSEFWQTHPSSQRPKAEATLRAQTTSPASSVAVSAPSPASISKRSGWDWSCPGPVPGGQHVIDVLLLYTSGILAEYGNTTNVHNELLSALDDANLSLRNSGILNITFSPRGPELLPDPPPPTYDEMLIVDALDKIAGVTRLDNFPFYLFDDPPGNPYVVGRRNAMWSDIVALARIDPTGLCGVAYGNNVVVNNGYATEPGPDFEKLAYLVMTPAATLTSSIWPTSWAISWDWNTIRRISKMHGAGILRRVPGRMDISAALAIRSSDSEP